MDDSGLHVSFNFRTTYLGISNNFWCGFWVNGQLLHCFYWHIIKLSVGSSAFFASCTCLSTGRLSGGHKQTWCICDYIGLENSILGARKLRFFCERNLAHTNTNNMCRNSWLSLNLPSNYGVNETISTNFAFFFPVRSQRGDAEHRLSLEQALQQTLRPICNWPWINPLLKRWRIGKTRFGFTSVKPTVAFGRRLVRRYKKRTRAQHCFRIWAAILTIICVFFDFFTCWDLIHWWNLNVRNYWDHLKLNMTTYFYYADWVEIWRNLFGQELSSNSSSFCSFGTQNFHLLMYLYNYLFLTMKWNHKWGLGWKALSYITKSIFLLSTNPRYLFQSRVVLWGHIFSIFDCTCVGGTQLTDLLADAICLPKTSISETPHVSIFAADISGICSVYTAHMEDQISPSWNKFVVLPHFGANVCVCTPL